MICEVNAEKHLSLQNVISQADALQNVISQAKALQNVISQKIENSDWSGLW